MEKTKPTNRPILDSVPPADVLRRLDRSWRFKATEDGKSYRYKFYELAWSADAGRKAPSGRFIEIAEHIITGAKPVHLSLPNIEMDFMHLGQIYLDPEEISFVTDNHDGIAIDHEGIRYESLYNPSASIRIAASGILRPEASLR